MDEWSLFALGSLLLQTFFHLGLETLGLAAKDWGGFGAPS